LGKEDVLSLIETINGTFGFQSIINAD